MKFAKYVYYIAGFYGIVALAPMYLMESQVGADNPPAITHPEFFYGFVGVALVFQFVFIVMAGNVLKYRPLMPITFLEKLSFAAPTAILYFQNRLSTQFFAAGMIDLFLGILFFIAFLNTGKENLTDK